MKTVGFVDYYISEWHANNYPEWIKSVCAETGQDFCVRYAWAERYDSPVYGENTDQWCERYGVERCGTLEELCEKADYIVILAPSDPEKHLGYAEVALRYGKNTYIDKTFAPDHATAKAIFDIAEANGTRFFSSSALRYASELDGLCGSGAVITTGGGGSLQEYIIHQAEMLIKLTEAELVALTVEKQGMGQYICNVELSGGKSGKMIYSASLPFGVYVEKNDGNTVYKNVSSDFFRGLITDMLRFFETGETSFDTAQTLSVMKVREAAVKGLERLGERIII